MTINELEEKLKLNGYKVTSQRKAILDVLIKNKGRFMSAENIHSKTVNNHPKLNLTTIYRNLEILASINLIHKIHRQEGISQYGVICTNSHHHHIICKKCGRTEVIDFCPLQQYMNLAKKKNFTLTEHKIELYGYCNKCKE